MNTNKQDCFGLNAEALLNKKLFLFDVDGTICNEDNLFDGTLELLQKIDDIGGKYVFVTNNSSKSVDSYIEKMDRLGIKADSSNFFTASQATMLYLNKFYPGKKLYFQGTESLLSELVKNGFDVTTEVSDDAEIILVGFDTEITNQKIRNTCEMLGHDIPYFATNPDLACPAEFGFVPDCGSICMMYENATKRKPAFIGKPSPEIVNFVREKFDYSAEETVIIGDRLYTDIATGINAGVSSICVLTGEATIGEIENSDIKPTYTFESVKEIFELYQ